MNKREHMFPNISAQPIYKEKHMATFTFREVATIYTTVVADTEEQAWLELDKVAVVLPDNMVVDMHECEIHEIGE